MPDADIWRTVPTARLGRRLLVCPSLPSTNDLAAGLAPGEAVQALEQTAGRGQFGRAWSCPPGDGLLLSVRLDPPLALRRPVLLTALAAVAVGDAVAALLGTVPVVKWPNDLLLGGRKVCGILIEQTRATVVGVGLNLRPPAGGFPAAGLPDATSLAEHGAGVSPDRAADAVLIALDARYTELLAAPDPLGAAWRDRLGLVGRVVVAGHPDGGTVVGRLVELGFDRVTLQTPAGEVTLAPERVRQLRLA